MALIMYKTGDPCPCCGQPIRLKSAADLYAFSVVCEFTGLNSVARTDANFKAAIARREAQKAQAEGLHDVVARSRRHKG